MSFTYSAAWTGPRDYVRFLVQDTLAASPQFQDEELDALLVNWGGDARMAAAEALEAWASLLSRTAVKYWVTGFGLDRTRTVEFMLKAAAKLRDDARAVPFEFESVVDGYITAYGEDWSTYIDSVGSPWV